MRTHNPGQNGNRAPRWSLYPLAQALLAGLLLWANGALAVCVGTTPCVNNTPLYIVSASPPNVLMILSNAQNMDEAPDGRAAGANSPDSKSWQARDVVSTLISNYSGQVNLGLMSFKLNGTSNKGLYQSPYDASYDPANWNPSYSGNRDSSTKKFCMSNPSNPGTCTAAANNLSGSCTGGDCIFYNVNLPFYGSSSGSEQMYCLSQSANFDNGSETYPGGPWDSYRCYSSKTGSSDFTANNWPPNAGTLGYSGGYNTYSFSPTDSDLAQNILDFGKQLASTYAAPAYYVNSSPGPGYLNVPISPLNGTQATAINNKLACNLPGYPNPLPSGFTKPANIVACTNNGIVNAGLTPIEGSISSANNYFTGTLTSGEGKVSSTYSSPHYSVNANSCSKNYAILLTNGLPNVDKTGAVITTSGKPDPTKALQQAASAAQTLHGSSVDLYVVGFAMPFGTDPTNLDTIAISGGTGQSYYASNSAALQTTLNSVFTSILQSSGSSSALASNSTSVGTNTYVYQASFDATDWTGKLDAYQITTNTSGGKTTSSVSSSAQWQASKLIPAAASRTIFTWDGTQGQSFLWANLSGDEQCYLDGQAPGCVLSGTTGQNVLNYLRGDSSLEQKNGVGSYRNRSTPLGDIVDSNPLYLSNEDYGYTALPGNEGSTYSSYVQGKTVSKIYVGANDGMLHAFDAASGVESWAYVPGAVYPHLADLAYGSYNANHEYFVDGSPGSGDAYYSGAWHTILLGTLGATSGTKAAFALDITNPASMTNSKVMWEFTDANDLGQTWGRGSVARFNDGNYYAVVNNGYNSVNKHAVLFLVQVNNPSNVVKLDTGVGSGASPNGLSQPVLLDADHNGTIDAIYAGDLQGDVWKFDVSSTTKGNWQVGYSGLPLFKSRDASGTVQPITAPLALGSLPSGATGTVMVFFGTGQYLNTSDISDTSAQTLYGVLDSSVLSGGAFTGGTSNFTRSTQVSGSNVMVQQSIDTETSATRGVTSNAVNYAGGKLGWYMDLITPPATQQGERVISEPLIRSGRVVFVTLIPGTNPCIPGGTSWVMELDAASGGAPTSAFLDYNNDGTYDTVTLSNGSSSSAVGVHLTQGFGHTPVSMTSGNSSTTVTNTSSGSLSSWNALNSTGTPRASWSQIK